MRPKDPCKVPLKDTSLRKETYHVLVLKAKKNLWKGNTVVFAYNPQMWRNKMKEELVRGTKKKKKIDKGMLLQAKIQNFCQEMGALCG